VSAKEIAVIADFLRMDEREFIETRTRLTRDRRGLSLTEKPNGECLYLGEEAGKAVCLIQAVKPAQCGGFPLEWNFPGWEKECRGAGEKTEGNRCK